MTYTLLLSHVIAFGAGMYLVIIVNGRVFRKTGKCCCYYDGWRKSKWKDCSGR